MQVSLFLSFFTIARWEVHSCHICQWKQHSCQRYWPTNMCRSVQYVLTSSMSSKVSQALFLSEMSIVKTGCLCAEHRHSRGKAGATQYVYFLEGKAVCGIAEAIVWCHAGIWWRGHDLSCVDQRTELWEQDQGTSGSVIGFWKRQRGDNKYQCENRIHSPFCSHSPFLYALDFSVISSHQTCSIICPTSWPCACSQFKTIVLKWHCPFSTMPARVQGACWALCMWTRGLLSWPS